MVKRLFTGMSVVIACLCLSGLLLTTGLPQETLSAGTALPQLENNRKEQIIHHEGFTVSYNADFRIANWTIYELTADEAKSKNVKRQNRFFPDPEVKGAMATDDDYRRSGYDRGHLVPAGDMKWSEEGMRASFYYSNICPQNKKLNTGLWNSLERQCRTWAVKYGGITIITGPVIEDTMNRLGKNEIGIPDKFFKVVSLTTGDKAECIGFLVENRDYASRLLKETVVTVDSIEKITGIRFFASFPAETRQEMTYTIDWDYWKFSRSK
jgi:endonuclease G